VMPCCGALTLRWPETHRAVLLVQRGGVKKNERRWVGRAWRAVDDLHRDGATSAAVLQAAIDLEDTTHGITRPKFGPP
jgi:hypothetical protein